MKNYSSIKKRQAFCWLVLRVIGFIIVAAIVIGLQALAYAIVNESDFPKESEGLVLIIAYILNGIILVGWFIYTFIMPFLQQAVWKYVITDDFIEIRYGVIIKKIKIVPEARIQHLDVTRLISDRIFGLARVSATTANGVITIVGLNPKLAEEIANSVNDRVNTLIRQENSVEGAN